MIERAPASQRRRVLFFCPRASHVGGGSGVLAWMMQALQDDYDVTLLTTRRVHLDRLDRTFGTSLAGGSIDLVQGPRVPVELTPFRFALLEQNVVFRAAGRMASAFDVLVSNTNEADCGLRLVQYVHFPWSYMPRPGADLQWYHTQPMLRWYRRLCMRLSGFREESLVRNLSLVNSAWTGGKLGELSRGQADWACVRPPIPVNRHHVDWHDREDAMAIVGRLSGEKRLEVAVDIVARVRAAGHSLRLHIVGPADGQLYAKRIGRLTRGLSWVQRHEDLSRAELESFMARVKFGLHAMTDEHFGMAPAEMAAAGCVVFVHASGGPLEIVGGEPDVCWETPEEAAEKIVRVLRDPSRQVALSGQLRARTAAWAPEQFMARFRWVVDRWPDVTGSDYRRVWGT